MRFAIFVAPSYLGFAFVLFITVTGIISRWLEIRNLKIWQGNSGPVCEVAFMLMKDKDDGKKKKKPEEEDEEGCPFC